MAVLYVASDQEGDGKTALCAGLARKMRDQGRKVALFKPLAAGGPGPAPDPDVDLYGSLLGQQTQDWPIDLPAEGLTPAILAQINDAFKEASQGADVVVVEGSSALSPEDSHRVAEALDAKAVAVARFRHDMPAPRLSHWRAAFGERLLGLVVNGLTRYLGTYARTTLLPSIESEGMECLGIVPEDRRLLGVTVGQLAAHLEGRFVVGGESTDGLVEHLMVGGMGMDPGELYFGLRENKAVIVRGDRPDIQMAALNTSTSCMVLTKGIELIEYVQYEAEQEEVPVMVVETDTLGTMAALNTLMDGARFDHPLKIDRYADLLERHIDLPSLFAALDDS